MSATTAPTIPRMTLPPRPYADGEIVYMRHDPTTPRIVLGPVYHPHRGGDSGTWFVHTTTQLGIDYGLLPMFATVADLSREPWPVENGGDV